MTESWRGVNWPLCKRNWQHPKTQGVCYIRIEHRNGVILNGWTRRQSYYTWLNKEVGLLYTPGQGGRVIIYGWTRRQGYYTWLNKKAVLANFSRNSFYKEVFRYELRGGRKLWCTFSAYMSMHIVHWGRLCHSPMDLGSGVLDLAMSRATAYGKLTQDFSHLGLPPVPTDVFVCWETESAALHWASSSPLSVHLSSHHC